MCRLQGGVYCTLGQLRAILPRAACAARVRRQARPTRRIRP